MVGLYIHIPFCTRKCHYCNFVTAPSRPAPARGVFLDALEREAPLRAADVWGQIFDTVYLGGGTPSTLDADEFERLFGILRANFRWKRDAEITCEANPEDMDADKAALLMALGVNRVSLGAQSFHDRTLKRLNRSHDAAGIESSFRLLRGAGFVNINLDLILSLPGEPWDSARASLERLAELGPEHVSLYELSVEDKTVFGRLKGRGELELPDEEEQFEILSRARAFLRENGYAHYELLSYARPDRQSRHNLLYWANEPTLGLGPGAYSYFGLTRWRFSGSYRQYLAKVASGDWTNEEEETLSAEKKEVESFLLALRLSEGASLERFGTVAKRLGAQVRELTEKGLLELSGQRLRLTERGQFLAETVFAELSC